MRSACSSQMLEHLVAVPTLWSLTCQQIRQSQQAEGMSHDQHLTPGRWTGTLHAPVCQESACSTGPNASVPGHPQKKCFRQTPPVEKTWNAKCPLHK